MSEPKKPLKRTKIGDEAIIAFGGNSNRNAKIVVKDAKEDRHLTLMLIPEGGDGQGKLRFDVHEKREKPTVVYKSVDFGEIDVKKFDENVASDVLETMTKIDLESEEWKDREALVPDDLTKAIQRRELQLRVNGEGPFKRMKVCQLKEVAFELALVEIGDEVHGILRKEGLYYHLDLAKLEPILSQFLVSKMQS